MELDTPEAGSITTRVHLLNVEKMTGRRPKELLEEPELPASAGYLWRRFWELDGCRAAGFAGLLPISYVELDAWSR